MATKKRSQRRISISGSTYDRLKKHCERQGVSISQPIEALVEDVGAKP